MIQTIPDSIRRAMRSPLCAVLGPDRGAEAELGVVGELDRLLLGVDDDDRQHRAEDLLAHDPHLVRDPGQHGRGDEAAASGPSTSVGPPRQLGRRRTSTASSTSSSTMLGLVRRRPSGRSRSPSSIGSPTVSRSVSRTTPSMNRSATVSHDVDALDPRAGLAGVGEAAPDGAGDRVREVGVGADDLRVLAAELQDRALHAASRTRADLAADLDRAGEEDLPALDLTSASPTRAAAVDGADEPLGQARLLEDAAGSARRCSGVRLAGFSTTPLPPSARSPPRRRGSTTGSSRARSRRRRRSARR